MVDFVVEREILIKARPETVFSFFRDPELFARWWGEGSSIEGEVGGRLSIRYPNGKTASGEIKAMEENRRIVFSFGYEADDGPFPGGSTTVEVSLEGREDGTLLRLRHSDLPDEAMRDAHGGGWRYQLGLFANVASQAQNDGLAARLDDYFAAWSEPDDARRAALLERTTTLTVRHRDVYGAVDGRDELEDYVAAALVHMPGMTLGRDGEPSVVHGHARVPWVLTATSGKVVSRGVNFAELSPDGRIAASVGFWLT